MVVFRLTSDRRVDDWGALKSPPRKPSPPFLGPEDVVDRYMVQIPFSFCDKIVYTCVS